MELVGMSVVTGALGRFCEQNWALSAALSGGVWSGTLPLTNLLDASLIARPARCLAPSNPASCQFDLAMPQAKAINLVALLAHTLSAVAEWRLSFAPTGGSLAAPSYQTPWLPIFPRQSASLALAWEDADWWTGRPSGADLDLYPRHAIWACPASVTVPVAQFVRVEIKDPVSPFIDIGALWVGAGWSPQCNFDRGRTLGFERRDLIEEGPSGRLFSELRTPRRTLSLTWSGLSDAEAQRLFDSGVRQTGNRWVLFVPDADLPAGLARECWPAVWGDAPAPVFNFSGANQVRATLKEVLA
jgi:hypothetical protein